MHLASQTRSKDEGQLVNIWAFKNKRPEISQYPCLFPLPRASRPSKFFVPSWPFVWLLYVLIPQAQSSSGEVGCWLLGELAWRNSFRKCHPPEFWESFQLKEPGSVLFLHPVLFPSLRWTTCIKQTQGLERSRGVITFPWSVLLERQIIYWNKGWAAWGNDFTNSNSSSLWALK